MMKSHLKAIKGKLPKRIQIGEWSEMKIVSYLRFLTHFTMDGKFMVNEEKRKTAESMQDDFWQEFLTRIDRTTTNPEATHKQFMMRLIVMSKTVLSWLKDNPHAINEEMRGLMEANPRCHWALTSFKDVPTAIGGTTTVFTNEENTDPHRANANLTSTQSNTPQAKLNQSLMNLASALDELTSSFKRGELSKISAEQKIKLAIPLLQALQKSFTKQSPNSVVFQKIVVNKSGREDLEKALLGYTDNNATDEE